VATFAAIVAAYQPPLRQLFVVYAPGADGEYASAFALFLDLKPLCDAAPGVVLASADDGNAILFHTECSVIANNFILTASDAEHIAETRRLMRLSPAEIRAQRPDVKYVLVRVHDVSSIGDDGRWHIDAANPLAKQLFLDDEPPPGFTLVKTIRRRIGPDDEPETYARLYQVSAS
jgi:hypothetical protein